jgi:hypothetical protein
MTIRLPVAVLVVAILLSAVAAFVLASITQPAPSDAAPGGTSAVVKQLKKLNKKVATSNSELTDINSHLGSGSGSAGTVVGYLHDIERHTSGTCLSTNDFAGTFHASDCSTIYSARPSR